MYTSPQSQTESLSVVIPAYNEESFIADTLNSVFQAKKHYPAPAEVIVVDNNSSDRTGEVARRHGAQVVFERKNQIARARNTGARAASGKTLVFLDADTAIHGDILQKVGRTMSTGNTIGGGAWVLPDSNVLGRMSFQYLVNVPLALGNLSVGPFLYCERSAFQRLGGFDEELYAAEEFSLAKRLQQFGSGQGKKWHIIKHDKSHRIVTSDRKLGALGVLEMAARNMHLLWNPQQKLRSKDACRFWYETKRLH